MNELDKLQEAEATALCKSCGLCCTGHLFAWAKLRPAELDPAEELGLNVFRSEPTERGFSQPCPLWHGQCTIYSSDRYPHVCRAYKCKLLKQVMAGDASLAHALKAVKQAKTMIRELEIFLPVSANPNFRERLVVRLEAMEGPVQDEHEEREFRLKADVLLSFYEKVFGVDDLIEKPDEL
jgi:hypothetical protein